MSYNKILHNKKFNDILTELAMLEKDRKFCCHGIDHLLDVARVAYIISLEKGLALDKDIVYAAALLHDIGRCEQYKNGTPHNEAGTKIAADILEQCGYTSDEIALITKAVFDHRCKSGDGLSDIIYSADKLTRRCFCCKAIDECNWADERKNLYMRY